jgi:signal transduction histidine kinase
MHRDAPQLRDTSDGPGLRSIFEGVGYTGLFSAAFIEFVPATILLAAQAATVPPAMWLTLLLPVVLVACALPFASSQYRPWILNGGGLLLLVLQTFVHQPYGPAWFPYNFAAFAVAFGAAFSLSVAPALMMIFAAALLNLIVVMKPTGQAILLAADLAGGLVGPAIVIIVGGSFVGVAQGWRHMATESDERTHEIEQATEAAYQAAHVQSARTAIERRIHETILNTLNAVKHGWDFDPELLRSECRRDVEQLDMGKLPSAPQSLQQVVVEAQAVAGSTGVAVSALVDWDIALSPQVASAVRDALVEILRNVHRHSMASRCDLRASFDDAKLLVEVADDGVGFSRDAQERFGLRNTIRASISAVGGTTEVRNRPGGGAIVRIDVPIVDPPELKLPAEPALDILLQPLSTRLFLLGGAAFGLLMLPWMAGPFGGGSLRFVLAFGTFAAASLVLALAWHQRWRTLAVIGVVVATVLLYATVERSITTCEEAPSIHWMINAVGSCLGLVLFASARTRWNWLVLPGLLGLGLWLMFTFPSSCAPMLVMPLLATLTYLSAAMYLIRVLLAASDRQRSRATQLWTEATAKRAEVAKQLEVTAQWNRVSAGTRALLVDIADGGLDPSDPAVRQRAASEEGQLRASLGIRRNADSAIWQDLLDVVDRAASLGLQVDADAIEFPSQDRGLPVQVLALLDGVVARSSGQSVSLRLFVDRGIPEVVCTCQQSTAIAAWAECFGDSASSAPVSADAGDGTVMSLEFMEGGVACVSIRQGSNDLGVDVAQAAHPQHS